MTRIERGMRRTAMLVTALGLGFVGSAGVDGAFTPATMAVRPQLGTPGVQDAQRTSAAGDTRGGTRAAAMSGSGRQDGVPASSGAPSILPAAPRAAGMPFAAEQPFTAADPLCVAIPGVQDRCPQWSAYTTDVNAGRDLQMVAEDHHGTVYLTAGTTLVAYDAGSGQQRWVSQASTTLGTLNAVAVAPGDATVYVMGVPDNPSGKTQDCRFTLAAYNAVTGANRWMSTVPCHTVWAPATTVMYASRLADNGAIYPSLIPSTDGRTVFLGLNVGCSCDLGFTGFDPIHVKGAILSFDAATGRFQWLSFYASDDCNRCSMAGLVLSPDGRTAYATGSVKAIDETAGEYSVDTTAAYATSSGDRLWRAQHPGSCTSPPCSSLGIAVAASPDGSLVYVGEAYNCSLLAYAAGSGRTAWTAQLDPTDNCYPMGLAVTDTAVVIGGDDRSAVTTSTCGESPTLGAFGLTHGDQRWVATAQLVNLCDDGNVPIDSHAVAMAATGNRIFVGENDFDWGLGRRGGLRVLGYDIGSGALSWRADYTTQGAGVPDGDIDAMGMLLADAHSRLFVSGYFSSIGTGNFVLGFDGS